MLSILLACTSTPDDSVPASSPCEEETRAGTLAVGDTFQGETLGVEVLELNPDPIIVGDNAWLLGLDLSGCEAELGTWMPDHQHGSSVGEVEVTDARAQVTDLFLSMGGYWELTLTLSCPEVTEEVLIPLCVEP
jgi:hypothetical protein